ncbi:MAG: hypothetical protein ACSHYF_17050 [Verrucomicrobiaceae bacterium]
MKSLLTYLCVTGFAIVAAHGAAITVANSSFESTTGVTNVGDWSNDLSPSWAEAGGVSNSGAFGEYIAGFSADGNNHVGVTTGYYLWQDTGVALQPNTQYTLSIAAGNRSGHTAVNSSTYGLLAGAANLGAASLANTAAVLADSSHLASAQWDAAANVTADQFADAPALVFVTGAVVPSENLVILLGDNSASGRTHFDNIRLDATAIPELSSSLLAGLAGLTLLRRRR